MRKKNNQNKVCERRNNSYILDVEKSSIYENKTHWVKGIILLYKPPRISLEGEFMKPRMKCVTAGGKAFTADRIWPEKYFPEKVNLNNCTNTFRIYCRVTV